MKKETLEKGRILDYEIEALKEVCIDPRNNPFKGFKTELRLIRSDYGVDIYDLLSENSKAQIAIKEKELDNLIRADLQAQLAALEKEFAELSDETMTDNQ